MIKWLIGLVVPALAEALKPYIEDIIKSAIDDANAALVSDVDSVLSGIQAIPGELLSAVTKDMPTVIAGIVPGIQQAIQNLNPFKGIGL